MIQQLASEDIHRLIRNASETSSTGTMSRQLTLRAFILECVYLNCKPLPGTISTLIKVPSTLINRGTTSAMLLSHSKMSLLYERLPLMINLLTY